MGDGYNDSYIMVKCETMDPISSSSGDSNLESECLSKRNQSPPFYKIICKF